MSNINYAIRVLKKTTGLLNFRKILEKLNGRIKLEKSFNSFYNQLELFKESMAKSNAPLKSNITKIIPLFNDETSETYFDGHYIYHPAWAARILKSTDPELHIDISSTLHFCSMLSAFIPVHFFDYRPANLLLSDLATGKIDLTAIDFETDSINSLSCMHTVEHIGLGRYGDPIDFEGDIKAMKELARVLAPKGNLLFVVPIGIPRIEFNAHRIYAYEQIINCFPTLKLKEFALIGDNFLKEGLLINPPISITNDQHWGCGCFWFTK